MAENRVIVRTDIIDPHTYLDVELKYRELLEVVQSCGGYALYQQIYKYYGGRSKGFREIKKLEDLLLAGSEQFNNNKYIYLKITALKYLKYRDCEEVSESNINRHQLKPSFRPLMNSVYSFENYLDTKQIINTELSSQVLKRFLDKVRALLKVNRIPNIHLVKVEKDEFSNRLETKLKILGDRNGIYLTDFQEAQELQRSVLKFVWYDFDQDTEENTVQKSIRLISRLLNEVGTKGQLNCCQFSLEIITTGEQRKAILEKLTNKAKKSIESKNEYYLKNSSIKTKENPIISGLTEVKYIVYPHIEGYTKLSCKGDSEFSFADGKTVQRLEQLKDIIKGGGT